MIGMGKVEQIGKVTVNWGSMFSGKTEELLRLLRRKKIAGKRVKVIKPVLDNRHGLGEVVTHNGDWLACTALKNLQEIQEEDWTDVEVVGIDEGQFFGEELLDVIRFFKYQGLEVIVSGLDMWSDGEPVRCMADAAAISNVQNKFNAVCVKTGKEAYISHSLEKKEDDVKVGGKEAYMAVCEEVHWELERKKVLQE